MLWFVTASPWLRGLAVVVVLAAALGLGYWLREGSVAGLQARLDQRGQRLAQAQEERVQQEEATLQARLEIVDVRSELGRITEERAALERDLAATEADLQAEVAQAVADSAQLEAALLLEAQAISASLTIAQEKTSVAYLLQQQGFSAATTSQYDVAADFFARAAQRYSESLPALEGIMQQRRELSFAVPPAAQLVFAQAATRAEADVEFAAALTAEFTGGAKLYRIVHELITTGDVATQRDNERWAALLAGASQDLEDGLARLGEAQELAPELWRLVEGRRLDFESWQSFRDDIQSALEAALG